MKILSLLRSERRTPEWTYIAHGTIWRIEISRSGEILGESRDQQRKVVSFFCLEGETGAPRWEDLKLEEPWWVGIESVQEDTLLLHQFTQPDMPEHKRILAFDIHSGRERWRNDELTYWFGNRDKVYAYRDTFEKRIGYELDLETGVIEQTFSENLDELRALRTAALQDRPSGESRFPEILDEGTQESSIAGVVQKETKGKKAAGHVEYVREGDLLLFNYHELGRGSSSEAPLYDNRFVIVDLQRGKRVFSEVLANGLRTPVPDSFFIRLPFVYFVKNQNTLTAIRLWKS
jgi:hypothetical protein